METTKLRDRSIKRKQPALKPLQKLFVGDAIGQANRKRQPPTLAKLEFIKKENKS
jgi:hypothetical protein